MQLNESKPDPTDDPFGFLRQISNHVADNRSDLFATIQKRLKFLDSEFKATGGTIPDSFQRQQEAFDLLHETFQMLQAYLEIVRQEDSD